MSSSLNKSPSLFFLFLLLTLLTLTLGLTSSEEERLVLHSDDGVIDEKLRELPGGILIPPEPRILPVPTMDPQLPPAPPKVSRISSEKVSRRSSYGQSSHVRSIVQSMRERMKNPTGSSMTSSFAQRSRSSSLPLLLSTTPPNTLEMALKRIEILASRAGFNMSSIPRRSQLQIVTRLSDKLPSKMSAAVKAALKANDVKVYEYLPEPARDPLLEDDPEFLGHFLPHQDVDDFQDANEENRRSSSSAIDASQISITSDNYKPPAAVYSEADLSYFKVPQEETITGGGGGRPSYDFLRSSAAAAVEQIPQESQNHNHRAIPAYTTTTTTTTAKPVPSFIADKWAPPKRVVILTSTTTTTTTEEPTTTTEATTTTTEAPHHPQRSSKEVKQQRPIKVSIVTEESSNSDLPQESTTGESQKKYVEVQPLQQRNSSSSSLLFQVESPATSGDLGSSSLSSSDDLTEEEIAAMVEELQKYEDNLEDDSSSKKNNKNILEFQYQRLLEPHPLEYPDHPDHLDNKIKATTTTTTAASPTTATTAAHHRPPLPQQHHHHHHHHGRPPPPPRRPLMRPHPGAAAAAAGGRPPRPPGGPPPLRINSVQVSEIPQNFNKECDFFSNEICLLAKDYPVEQISSQLESNPALALSLLPREQPDSSAADNNKDPSSSSSPSKLSGEGGFLCPSKVAYGKIKKAKSSTTGKWKWIVNYGDHTQTIRIEKCLTPGDKCSYVQPHYRTACTQVYNYHRLVSWDATNGIHVDTYKVPTCCTCHVQGYYIPSHPQSPANLLPQQQQHSRPHPPPPPQMMQRRRMGPPHPPHHHNNGPPPPPQSRRLVPEQPNNTPVPAEDDGDLEDLLKQYALLRDKIAKTKGSSSDSPPDDLSTHLDFLLKKRKRSSSSPAAKSSTSLKKLLRKLHVERNLRGKALLSSAKTYIRKRNKKSSSSRASRTMKTSSSSSNNNQHLQLLNLLKKIKEKKIRSHIKAKLNSSAATSSSAAARNYRHHPIMDFYYNSSPHRQRQSRRHRSSPSPNKF